MPAPFDNIVQHLFHQPSLLSVTIDELERMVMQHPYFAAAHFLLLKKMQDTTHPHFKTQLQKTALYFNNPLWLQFLLQPKAESNFTISAEAPFISDEPAATDTSFSPVEKAADEVSDQQNPASIGEEAEESAPPQAAEYPGEPITLVNDAENNGGLPGEYLEPAVHDVVEQVEEPVVIDQAVEEIKSESVNSEDLPSVVEAAVETATEFSVTEQVEEDNSQEAVHGNEAAQPVVGEGEETLPEPMATEQPVQENNIEPSQEYLPPATGTTEEHDDTEAFEPEPELLQIPLLKTIIETPAAKNDTLFEPYHTVDYFASQGIKLSRIEAESKDKFGMQLKSFTDWLKTMKKLPKVSVDKILAENEESKVVADAHHSIEVKEVITEAMAEVFEKQGLYEKAGEVYRKLSLLNPAKSVYFAARIEALKH